VSLWALLASLPVLYWSEGTGSAGALKEAGFERLMVPPERVAAFRQAGLAAEAMSEAELAAREKLPVPGITFRADVASATRSPWVNSNGWRFQRRPSGRYRYELPAGKAVLAAAEAAAYGSEAVLSIQAEDVPPLGRLLAFLRQLPPADLPSVADLGVEDDGSPLVGEVLNLFTRRNLLFRVVAKPAPDLPLHVAVGSAEYPKEEAADPSAFALKVRRRLGDERRSLRVYGSEVVLCRLTRSADRARLHLLNYGGREVFGLRVRLLGTYGAGVALVFGELPRPVEALAQGDGATEFSLPVLREYAVVDLTVPR
jgi:hypothetical protein